MSKSKKKRKKNAQISPEEREALRQERAELTAKQNRRMLYLIGGIIICIVILIAALVAPFNTGKADGYTYGQYQRLRTGMSHQQVVKILGDEGKALSSASSAEDTYIWKNKDGTQITITFEDDAIVSFNQKGLSD